MEERPSVLHVAEWMSPLTGGEKWLEPGLVDEHGVCRILLPNPEDKPLQVLKIAAVPWEWEVWSWAGASAAEQTYVLRPNPIPVKRLQSMPGLVSAADATHPLTRRDALREVADSLRRKISFDLMLATGSVSGGDRIADLDVWATSDSIFAQAWAELGEGFQDVWPISQMLQAVQKSFRHDLGFSCQVDWRDDDFGNMQAWESIHLNWWERPQVAWDSIRLAVHNLDSVALKKAMPCQESNQHLESCLAAWLLKEKHAPDAWTRKVLDEFPLSESLAKLRNDLRKNQRQGLPGSMPDDFRWVSPSGDLEWVSEFQSTGWLVALVVQAGSATSTAERRVFQRIIEQWEKRKDLRFVVVSVDATEQGWTRTLHQRENRREQTRWIGGNPQIWNQWGIVSMPMVIALQPDGQISSQIRSLPSQGLAKEMTQALP